MIRPYTAQAGHLDGLPNDRDHAKTVYTHRQNYHRMCPTSADYRKEATDVGMVQSGNGPGFVLETLARLGAIGH